MAAPERELGLAACRRCLSTLPRIDWGPNASVADVQRLAQAEATGYEVLLADGRAYLLPPDEACNVEVVRGRVRLAVPPGRSWPGRITLVPGP